MKKKITAIALIGNPDDEVSIHGKGVASIELIPRGFYPFTGMVYDSDVYLVTRKNGNLIVFPADKYIAYWEDGE